MHKVPGPPEPQPEDFLDGRTVTDRGIYGPTYSRLYVMLFGRCRKLAVILGLRPDEAEDIASEICDKFTDRRSRDPIYLDAVRSALAQTNRWTINAVLNLNRDTKRQAEIRTELGEAWNLAARRFNDVEDSLENAEWEQCLIEAVRLLPMSQRDAFLFMREGGLSAEETGAKVGVNPQSVRNALVLAVKFIVAHMIAAGFQPTTGKPARRRKGPKPSTTNNPETQS